VSTSSIVKAKESISTENYDNFGSKKESMPSENYGKLNSKESSVKPMISEKKPVASKETRNMQLNPA
jgi:hypothetical protein